MVLRFGFWVLGFGVWGFGSWVWGSGFEVWGLGVGVRAPAGCFRRGLGWIGSSRLVCRRDGKKRAVSLGSTDGDPRWCRPAIRESE